MSPETPPQTAPGAKKCQASAELRPRPKLRLQLFPKFRPRRNPVSIAKKELGNAGAGRAPRHTDLPRLHLSSRPVQSRVFGSAGAGHRGKTNPPSLSSICQPGLLRHGFREGRRPRLLATGRCRWPSMPRGCFQDARLRARVFCKQAGAVS